jgi:hypothetical protein
MLIAALLIILILLIELAARIYETRQIAQTRVSTLSETDYATPSFGKWLAIGGLLAAVVALSAGLFWPLRPVGGLAVLALFVVLRATLSSQVLAAARVSMRARLREAIAHPEIQKARIAFYFSAPELERPEHLITWAEEINVLEISWFVILREPHHLKAFEEANLPTAIIVPDDTALVTCLPPLVRIVFYANNGQKNRKMLSFHPDAFHIQLLHGDSDKPPSYSPLTQNYDLVFVAGQMGIDRYAQNGVHIPVEKFRIIGRPQVRAISNLPRDKDGGLRKVVYMPTWRGFFEDTQFSSLDRASEIIETVLASNERLDLHFKPHPLSYKDPLWAQFEREIRTALNRKRPNGNQGVFREDGTSPFDLYNEADLLITDISSVMIDFLYSGKPFLVVEPHAFDAANACKFPSLDASYRVYSTLENLPAQMEAAISHDPLAKKREDVRVYAFGDYGRPPGEAFRETCLTLLNGSSGQTMTHGGRIG